MRIVIGLIILFLIYSPTFYYFTKDFNKKEEWNENRFKLKYFWELVLGAAFNTMFFGTIIILIPIAVILLAYIIGGLLLYLF